MAGMANKKKWSELPQPAKVAIVAGATVELAITAVALRDLIRRPSWQVKGPKTLWFLGCFVQPVGPILYLRSGRHR
jgi:hypothetical protein